MGNFKNEPSPYTKEWLEKRAFASLEKIGEGAWGFSDSLLLYDPKGAEEYVSLQENDTPYSRMVTKPEKEYLKEIAASIVDELPEQFQYIDLGPGSEHKEQFFFDAAKNKEKKFLYTPVDINDDFLELSDKYASRQRIRTSPLRASFEELPERLSEAGMPRFVSLGLTFSNYTPEKILRLLKSIAGEKGRAFVNAQIRDRIDMEELQKAYSGDTYKIFEPKIELLGLHPQEDISLRETDDGIRVWYTLKNSNDKLEEKGVVSGDKLLVFQSLRYDKESLEKEIAAVFPEYALYDTGKSFIGALLKT
jgi:hypothetical protein